MFEYLKIVNINISNPLKVKLRKTTKCMVLCCILAVFCLYAGATAKPHSESKGSIPNIKADDKQAKSYKIKGIVTDDKGEPLTGASVLIVNTKQWATTDLEGKFSLQTSVALPAEIEVSYIGMSPVRLTIDKPEESLMVIMSYDNNYLEEVVVTGYQEIDKRKLSSSIISKKMDDISIPSLTSIDGMLQGQLAGVSVMNVSSTPGVTPKIRIRGSSSITGNREPVWVVDGIILDEPVNVTTEELNNIDNINFIGNAISGLNPSDIERIDILKDVSATAIYGVKAANGVIVVTTKRGKEGRTHVTYNGTFSLQQAPRYSRLSLMNSKERIEMSEEMLQRGLEFKGVAPTSMAYEGLLGQLWNKEISYDEFRQGVVDLKNMNTDWMKLLFRDAPTHQNDLSVSGAGGRINYYFSVGHTSQNGFSTSENLSRLTAMMKLNIKLLDNLSAGIKISTGSTNSKYPHTSISLTDYAYKTSRAISPYTSKGTLQYYAKSKDRFGELPFNIFNELENTGRSIKSRNTTGTIYLNWDIAKWLKFNATGSVSANNTNTENWADEKSYYISKSRLVPFGVKPPETNEFYQYSTIPIGGELQQSTVENTRYTIRNSIDINKTFRGKHNISGVIGQELSSSHYKGFDSVNYGYMPFRGKSFANISVEKYKGYANLIGKTFPKISDTYTNTLSFYSALTYTYNDRYVINFNIRTDGSNRFGQDKSVRFLPVWSISGKWNAHEEKFIRKISWINTLGIRASYGIQGNVHPSQSPHLIVRQNNYNSLLGDFTSEIKQFPNHSLRWEKTISYNFGLDFAVLDNRISGTLDVYSKIGYDQIISRSIKPSNGATSVVINAGDVSNKGWEVSLNFVPIRNRNWTWSLSFNTGKNYNVIINEGDVTAKWSDYINGNIIRNGTAINSFYSYRFKGLDHKTGLPTFYGESEKDDKGNTIINSAEEAYAAAFVFSGKREPDLSGGFSSSLKFKRLTLNALISFSMGGHTRLNDLYLASGQGLPLPQQNMNKEFVNRWRQPGDEAFTNIPALSDEGMTFGTYERKFPIADNRWEMYNKSDIRVVSSSFLRCRSISLRYDFGKKILERLPFSNGSFTFEASNLFVIKDKRLGTQDPEQMPLYLGTVPPAAGFSGRLSLTF